ETHRAVFTWIQQRLVEVGLLKGKTVAIDATTLEANAAMRSIVRRDTGRRLMRCRGERVERSFAHVYDTGACAGRICAVTRTSSSVS
ncbi:MAG: hypothetical protein ABR606_03885, partial [Vicinamibacterales bacterium]